MKTLTGIFLLVFCVITAAIVRAEVTQADIDQSFYPYNGWTPQQKDTLRVM